MASNRHQQGNPLQALKRMQDLTISCAKCTSMGWLVCELKESAS
jgi:hypothetical protein